jgi:hypothetical protein
VICRQRRSTGRSAPNARPYSQGGIEGPFTGQITASIGFVVYSWLLRNWVFVVTNVLPFWGSVFIRTTNEDVNWGSFQGGFRFR